MKKKLLFWRVLEPRAVLLVYRCGDAQVLESAHSQRERGQKQSQHFALQNTVSELREKLARVSLQLLEVQKYVVPLAGKPGLRSPWTTTSWLEDNQDLLDLPRMNSFLSQLETCSYSNEITFSLCKQQSPNGISDTDTL